MAEKVFREMDKDLDGKVTLEEFIASVTRADSSVSKLLNNKLRDLITVKMKV